MRAARSDAIAQSQRVGSQLSELDQLSHQLSRSKDFRDSVDQTKAADFRRNYDEMTGMLDQLREGTQLSRSETAQLMFNGSASISGGLGVGLPPGSPVSASAGVGASAGTNYQSGDAASRAKVLERAASLGYDTRFGRSLSDTLHAGATLSSSYSGGDEKSYANTAASQLTKEAGHATATQASLERAKSFEEARRLTNTEGFGGRTQLDDKFKNWLAERLGSQDAALTLIREGAQGHRPDAQIELNRRMREFSDAYTANITSNVGPMSSGSVAAEGGSWMSSVRSGGESGVQQRREAGKVGIERDAGTAQLTGTSVEQRADAIRSDDDATRQKLAKDVETEQLKQAAHAFSVKHAADTRMAESERKSLSQQVILERLGNGESNPPDNQKK
jgi:hypothetical protein